MPYVCSWEIKFSMHLLGTHCEQSTILGKISTGLRYLQNRIRHNLVVEGDVCNQSLHQQLQGIKNPRIPRNSHYKRHLVFWGATLKGILWPGVGSFQILKSSPKSEMKMSIKPQKWFPVTTLNIRVYLRDKIGEWKNVRRKTKQKQKTNLF